MWTQGTRKWKKNSVEGEETETVSCSRYLSVFIHLLTKKNKHLYVSLGLTGGLRI